jgi:DNA polymerase III subunit delta'
MDYVNYLKEYQKVPYQVFSNALKDNLFFHAYLLSEPIGTPTLEIAKFLAKSILNGSNDFVKEETNLTQRVDNGNYADLIILDGKKGQIKIDDIRNIEDAFSKTAIEKIGIKIYIINLVENMASDATNALLKFLEEPLPNTYAFLTTENEFRVLPTIRSRSQIIHFSTINQNDLIADSINEGINEDDAQILSFFYNDPEIIKEESQDEDYLFAKTAVIEFLNRINNKDELRLYVEINCLKNLKDKTAFRFFIDMLLAFLKESLKLKYNEPIILSNFSSQLSLILKTIPNIDDKVIKLMNYRNELNYNLNTSLLLINLIESVFGA